MSDLDLMLGAGRVLEEHVAAIRIVGAYRDTGTMPECRAIACLDTGHTIVVAHPDDITPDAELERLHAELDVLTSAAPIPFRVTEPDSLDDESPIPFRLSDGGRHV